MYPIRPATPARTLFSDYLRRSANNSSHALINTSAVGCSRLHNAFTSGKFALMNGC